MKKAAKTILKILFFIYVPYISIPLLIIHLINKDIKKQQQKKIEQITEENKEYFDNTDTTYENILNDRGKTGEFKIYNALKNIPGYKKFLFNCYIPKQNGQYTEIDIIMLHQTGIYVFESKNYSGWIFGSETGNSWTQSLYIGYGETQKNHFFNPYLQNESHIYWLKKFLEMYTNIDYYSYVVFGNDAEFKKIEPSKKHYLSNLKDLYNMVEPNTKKEIRISEERIDTIYNKLFPFTILDDYVKEQHINNIKEKHN